MARYGWLGGVGGQTEGSRITVYSGTLYVALMFFAIESDMIRYAVF